MVAGVEPHAGAWLDRNGDGATRPPGIRAWRSIAGTCLKIDSKSTSSHYSILSRPWQSTSKDSSSGLVADSELLD